MLQIYQYQKTGELIIDELPEPPLRPGGVLVRNAFSLVSAGTERSSVETAQASLLGKAKRRPDLVRQVRNNIRREGLLATWRKVRTRLDSYAQLGYSSAGVVIKSAVDGLLPGDRVACAGTGYASHAEVIFVPQRLTAKLPPEVSFEEGAYTTLGAIALQGVRQADVRVGERAVVIGLGLVGLLTVQLLKASGCRVFGVDLRPELFDLARRCGCDDCAPSRFESLAAVQAFTRGVGADAVILTAATLSNEPIEWALHAVRKRGRVVVVGAIGMNLPRSPFYEKEVELRISCSYGPGRYDPDYEERGIDYPLPYVRWTEQRNMEAFLDLLAAKKVDVKPLTTHVFPINEALQAYELITGKRSEPHLGILISYPQQAAPRRTRVETAPRPLERPRIGFIGAGNFAQSYLLPPLVRAGASLSGVFTAHPTEAKSVAKKFGFAFCSGSADDVVQNADAVIIAARHDTHAHYVVKGLASGRHVYVEKPLAVTEEQLEEVIRAYRRYAEPSGLTLSVGFNRRFAPAMRAVKDFFMQRRLPLQMVIRVNAGYLPKEHWTQAPEQGGRLIGEACHFIDVMSFMTDSLPVTVYAESLVGAKPLIEADNCTLVVKYADGSLGTLIYTASGDSTLPKERYEFFGGGSAAVLDNFTELLFFRNGKRRRVRCSRSKGHAEEMAVFLKTLAGDRAPISFDSLIATTRTTFAAHRSLRSKTPQRIYLPEEPEERT